MNLMYYFNTELKCTLLLLIPQVVSSIAGPTGLYADLENWFVYLLTRPLLTFLNLFIE